MRHHAWLSHGSELLMDQLLELLRFQVFSVIHGIPPRFESTQGITRTRYQDA